MTTPAPGPADPNNVQGDILVGLPKKTQTYAFFTIDDARIKDFRSQLVHLLPLITSAVQAQNHREKILNHKQDAAKKNIHPPHHLKMSGVNLVFSQKGLTKLGIIDEIGDLVFKNGMLADVQTLGDEGAGKNWLPAFKKDIHGMILVSGDCHATVRHTLAEVEKIFHMGGQNAIIHEVLRVVGDVRPGMEKGHEHFGFADGISQPAVKDFDTHPNPGQETIRQGITLLGREGDTVTRPSWALDGSFLAFRYLSQLVPEFDTFLKHNPIAIPGLSPDKGSELLGARLVGRWKSGAPIDLAPTADDSAMGKDPKRNNNFRYDFPDDVQSQDRCPFAAHTRKTNPRADLEDFPSTAQPPLPKGPIPTEPHRIIRRGIQFGPEVTAPEAASGTTAHDRGLLFAAYQANIANGFQFIQSSWANNQGFPFGKIQPNKQPLNPGFDPIIGQAADPASRTMGGTNPDAQGFNLPLTTEWVVPKGGEYFFSPSISALKNTFAIGTQDGHAQEL